jgi:methylated-DNA-protein-cysteine methyltransferase-like protein
MKSVRSASAEAAARIRQAVAAIPAGCVASYGEVAACAGLPRRARLVGHILAQGSAGTPLPWHRVLRADGRIAFAPGSRAFREQVRLLAAEGVRVVRGRVELAGHAPERDLDAWLWGPPIGADGSPRRPRPSKTGVGRIGRSGKTGHGSRNRSAPRR